MKPKMGLKPTTQNRKYNITIHLYFGQLIFLKYNYIIYPYYTLYSIFQEFLFMCLRFYILNLLYL